MSAYTGGGSTLIDAEHPTLVPIPKIRPFPDMPLVKAAALALGTALLVGGLLYFVARKYQVTGSSGGTSNDVPLRRSA